MKPFLAFAVILVKELKMMETGKVLSGLSYLSVFFAGIIFPLIVYFVAEDKRAQEHAKKALLSHLIVLIPVCLTFVTFIIEASNNAEFPVLFIISIILTILTSLIVTVWNIIKGIKVFTSEHF
jgi:hypothetical protein